MKQNIQVHRHKINEGYSLLLRMSNLSSSAEKATDGLMALQS